MRWAQVFGGWNTEAGIRVFKPGREVKVLAAQLCLTLYLHGLQPTSLLCPWASPGRNTGVGCHFLLQGIFPIEGSYLGLLHCRQTLYT